MNQQYKLLTIKAVILGLLCLALSTWLHFEETHNHVRLDVYIDSDHGDIFSIYWPDHLGRYSESSVQHVRYPAGKSGHAVTISSFLPFHSLRFDPGNQKGVMKVTKLSVSRYGETYQVLPDALQSSVSNTQDIEISQSAGGVLRLDYGPNDAQLYFSNFPIPRYPISWIFISFVLLIFTFWLYQKSRNNLQARVVQTISIALIVLLTVEITNFPELTELAIKISTTFVAVFLSLSYLLLNWQFRSVNSGFLKPTCSFMVIAALSYGIFNQTVVSANQIERYFNPLDKKSKLTLEGEHAWLERLKFYKKTFVSSLDESFNARKDLVNINAKIKIFGLNYIGTSKAILGKEGMYFEGYGDRMVEAEVVKSFDNVADYLGTSLYTQEELEAWAIAIEERYYWHKEQGIDYIFAIAPAKAHIYPENLPDKILTMDSRLNRTSRIDQLTGYLKSYSEVPVVDLRDVLLHQKSQDSRPLYYRADFHWNQIGAFYAYQAIVDAINLNYPKKNFQKSKLSDFEIERVDNWVSLQVMNMVGLDPYEQKNETYYTLKRKSNFSVASGDSQLEAYDIEVKRIENEGVSFPIVQFLNSSLPESTIFVIGDSFIESASKFFSRHARKVWNFRAIMDFSRKPYQDQKPDTVIQSIHNMYLLQPPPINDENLKKARRAALNKKGHDGLWKNKQAIKKEPF